MVSLEALKMLLESVANTDLGTPFTKTIHGSFWRPNYRYKSTLIVSVTWGENLPLHGKLYRKQLPWKVFRLVHTCLKMSTFLAYFHLTVVA